MRRCIIKCDRCGKEDGYGTLTLEGQLTMGGDLEKVHVDLCYGCYHMVELWLKGRADLVLTKEEEERQAAEKIREEKSRQSCSEFMKIRYHGGSTK